MTLQKIENKKTIESLRYVEYYGLQNTFDDLYEKSKNNFEFKNLIEIILSKENIILAYRNIKSNSGSNTPGTDNMTITDIGKLTTEEVVNKVRYIVQGSKHGYRPKPVRRKEIPKPNSKTRPLGIPCMWDRLVQQCIKQVLEPICEAKFSKNSYGFRPNCCAEHAIAATYKLLQVSHLNWVLEFDIEGFFDNVNHSKLIKQIWALGIHDKQLIYVLKQILKAPIKMSNGDIKIPEKGTPQGGIISPLLANIVLNELDQWIDGQWQDNPVVYKYKVGERANGSIDRSNGYWIMKTSTNLKQMFIIRYADDFRIFCNDRNVAIKIQCAVIDWLDKRLKLKISKEKTRIVNVKKQYMEFLGFKIKLQQKGHKYTVKSRMSDEALKKVTKELTQQAKNIARPRKGFREDEEIRLYNSKVLGVQNYYKIATEISKDFSVIYRRVMVIFTNRLKTEKGTRLLKTGRPLTEFENKLFGSSKMIRYVAGSKMPIYPIAYIKTKTPLLKRVKANNYTVEGRNEIHKSMSINTNIMYDLMHTKAYGRSIEYMDNKVSLYSAQKGKCCISGKEFTTSTEIHCHHKIPRNKGGTDKYNNLCLVLDDVHILIHATDENTINKYLNLLKLNAAQIKKLNNLRIKANVAQI